MTAERATLEVLVEEFSAERALSILIPRIASDVDFEIRTFRGKKDLLAKLPNRLRGYVNWVGRANTKIVVLVDRDGDDCRELKRELEDVAKKAGLTTLTCAAATAAPVVLNRIAVEELEAWFFGDIAAIRRAYPRVPPGVSTQARYRDADSIRGGTWEALERLLQKHGYFAGGLEKAVAAEQIAGYMDVDCNSSCSFRAFRDGLRRLVGSSAGGGDAAAN